LKTKPDIIFEDDLIVAINKPGGLLSIPDRFDQEKESALSLLRSSRPELYTVHRIDRDTSGLLLFAKTTDAHRLLNLAFEERLIKKLYLSVCHSKPTPPEGSIKAPIAHSPSGDGRMTIHPKGKESETLYKITKSWKEFSLIECMPLTGRTHQIRIHLAYIGCPIVGDPLYGIEKELRINDIKKYARMSKTGEPSPPIIQRTALHAYQLEFNLGENAYSLTCPIPKDMRALMNQLDKWQ